MAVATDFVIVDSRYDPAAACLVCGGMIEAGEGITARYRGRTLRFRCRGCLDRFLADPPRFLSSHEPECCASDHAESPASEWCD